MRLSNNKVITTSILLVICLLLLVKPVQGKLKGHGGPTRRLKGKASRRSGSSSRSGGGRGGMMMKGKPGAKASGSRGSNSYDEDYSDEDALDRAEDKHRNKDDKNTGSRDDPPRYGGASKIMSESEGDFLGGGRFNGETCLSAQSSCDIIDYRYRSDYLLESYNSEDEEEEGFCLTQLPDANGDGDSTSASGLIMKACDPTNPSQRWLFIRVGRGNPGIFNDGLDLDGLYIIQNPASGMIVRALETPGFLDQFDDIFDTKTKDEVPENSPYITGQSLATADMKDDKNLWVLNEDRFFLWNSTNILGLDDDIFGFSDLLPIDSQRQQQNKKGNRKNQ